MFKQLNFVFIRVLCQTLQIFWKESLQQKLLTIPTSLVHLSNNNMLHKVESVRWMDLSQLCNNSFYNQTVKHPCNVCGQMFDTEWFMWDYIRRDQVPMYLARICLVKIIMFFLQRGASKWKMKNQKNFEKVIEYWIKKIGYFPYSF